MDAERLRVLKMLEEGQITAEEAAKLLDALQPGPTPGRRTPTGRILRIRVMDATTGRVQASVNLPLAVAQTLAQAGSRIGILWAPQLGELDLPRILETIQAGEPGRVVEWTEGDSGRRVEVFIE